MSEIKTNKLSSLTGTNSDITLDPDGTGDTIIASGNAGIGTSSPSTKLHISGNASNASALSDTVTDFALKFDSATTTNYFSNAICFAEGANVNASIASFDGGSGGAQGLVFGTGASNTERMRIDSSGNLLVGTTSNTPGGGANTPGVALSSGSYGGLISATRDSGAVADFNRKTNDGGIVNLRKDGTIVGSIGVGNGLFVSAASKTGIRFPSGHWRPMNNGSDSDNAIDLGSASYRFDDIFATNGTIQTSDQNEKQQIASLTSAEITAAKAISKLFKTFKWNDSVTENGDNARTHTGVIAQQVETAMTDAGLDAGDYAFFISSDWYVDANGDEVESDAVGAIAKNRKGIRYPELLAFVGAATEQRLADIETRLTALENT